MDRNIPASSGTAPAVFIGQALLRSGRVRLAAVAVGVMIVGIDLTLAPFYKRPDLYHTLSWVRMGLVAVGFLALGLISRWDWASLGLRVGAAQPWTYWLKAAAILGLIVLTCTALTFGGLWLAGSRLPLKSIFTSSAQFLPWATEACIVFPILEEAIYRLILCTCFSAILSRWSVIILSGVVFALLHHLYGALAPTNAVAGFVLAWAYFKSGTLDVPIALHAAGNLCVGLFHLGLLYSA